ncbi:MAG: NAD-dependent epimerase/dehydratase family protein [Phycisphaerae bacterium]
MNLVTGATGLLGSHVVEQLRKQNRPVRALVRRGSDRSWLESQGVEFAEGDVTDPASLAAACRGVHVVYHSAARVGDWGPWEEFQRITIDGTQYLVDAAIAAGVRRFVHISSISTYGYHTDEVIVDETAPLGYKLYKWAYYSRSKIEAEQRVWQAQRAGKIETTIIRPAWLYGPRDRTTFPRLVRMLQEGRAKILGRGDNRLNVVYSGNVAEACILAADSPAAVGEAFNCSNDGEITQMQYFDLLARACKAPAVSRHVPYKVAYTAGFVLECLGHLFRSQKPPFITRYAVWLMGRRSYFSSEKARRVLGWKPTISYEVGVPLTLEWYFRNSQSAPATRDRRPVPAGAPG